MLTNNAIGSMNPDKAYEQEVKPKRTLEHILIELLLIQQEHEFTDIHIEPDQVVMGRIAGNHWVQALDLEGNPVRIKPRLIEIFLNDLYKQQSDGLMKDMNAETGVSWKVLLKKNYSLHPSLFLDEQLADGSTRAVRVRITVQRQGIGSGVGLMIRALRETPESTGSLGLPIQVSAMTKAPSGLILVAGPTGSGKTTTVAAMINEINTDRSANIVTIEDPVEYVHERKKSIINSREIGVDVVDFLTGVKDALRFVPDVISIGEILDADTMRAALRAAESGHLVMATIHAPSTTLACRKVLGYMGTAAEALSFAGSLVGIINQCLVVDENGKKHLAYEILNSRSSNGRVAQAITQSIHDPSGSKIDALETALRNGDLTHSSPMIASLKALRNRAKFDKLRLAAAAHFPEDVTELMKSS